MVIHMACSWRRPIQVISGASIIVIKRSMGHGYAGSTTDGTFDQPRNDVGPYADSAGLESTGTWHDLIGISRKRARPVGLASPRASSVRLAAVPPVQPRADRSRTGLARSAPGSGGPRRLSEEADDDIVPAGVSAASEQHLVTSRGPHADESRPRAAARGPMVTGTGRHGTSRWGYRDECLW
jgi:hypothetical protein